MFAIASVTQQRAASDVPIDDAKGLRLLARLARRPLWWAGFLGDTGGYIAQAIALGLGSLLVVQPTLVTTLLFALPLGAAWAGRRLHRSDWMWAVVLTAAIGVFLVAGNPTEGVDIASARDWAVAGAVLAPITAVCLVGGMRSRGVPRAVLLAAATGILYGVTAALTKSAVHQLGGGIGELLAGWEVYVLVVVAVGGTALQQAAFQSGALEASLPAVTVLEPVVAMVLGVTLFDEAIRADGVEWALIAVSVVAMVAGTLALSRSAAAADPAAAGRR